MVLIGVSFCLFVTFYMYYAYQFRDTTPRGPLVTVNDWPEPIQELYASLNEAGVDTKSFSVWLLHGQPASTLSTVVCRIEVDDSGWAAIQEKLDLKPVSKSKGAVMRDLIVPRSDESWWPSSHRSVEYFISAHALAGGEGDLYSAARDKASGRAFIYYDFNF